MTTNLFRHATEFETREAGVLIFREGDPGDAMYVVKEGEVDVEVHGKRIATIGPGEIFGEMALVDSRPRSATAIARTTCQLVPVDKRRFLYLVQQTPQFALQVMETLAGRLRAVDETL